MVQIALNKELSGNEADAKTWYGKVAKKFPRNNRRQEGFWSAR